MRILFITSNRLGDAILSTGLLGHLLDTYPEARFTVACGPVAAPVFQDLPRLDRLIVMRKGPLLSHWRTLLGYAMPKWWSAVVDVRGSATAWVLPTLRRRVFATRPGDGHRVEQLGRMFGLTPPPAPRLWIGEETARAVDRLLGDDPRPILAIGPTANWLAKTWPVERFVDLVGRLTADGPLRDARVAVVAAPAERSGALPLLESMPPDRQIDLLGTEALPVIGGVLERARLYVGNDSGLMHLAAAAGAPTLGLFGPSRPQNYRPWGPRADFVRTTATFEELRRSEHWTLHPTASLMTTLSVDAAEAAARSLLSRTADLDPVESIEDHGDGDLAHPLVAEANDALRLDDPDAGILGVDGGAAEKAD